DRNDGALTLLARPLLLLLGLDHVDAPLIERRQSLLNLLWSDLLRGHDRIELLVGNVVSLRDLLDGTSENRKGAAERPGSWDPSPVLPSAVLPWSCLPSVSPRPARACAGS